MSTPKPFHEAWSLEDTKDRLEQPPFPSNGTYADQDAWRLTIGRDQDDKISLAIGRHIAWVMGASVPVVPPFCENTDLKIVNALKTLNRDLHSEPLQMEAGRFFAHHLYVYCALMGKSGKDPVCEEVHANLMDVIQKGKFKFSASDHGVCPLSGMRLDVLFEGWESLAGTSEFVETPGKILGTYTFTPLSEGQVPTQTVQCTSIPVPTGEIWIADWFCIPTFQDIIAPIDEDQDHDIGTVRGRATRTTRYAEELGVAHVACGSVDILHDEGGVIKAGYLDREADKTPVNFKGSITGGGLRWTTMVDRGHLVDLLSSYIGKEDAEKQVKEYYKEHKRDIIKVRVEPGTHHLYYAGTPRFFENTINTQYQAEGLFLEDFQEPAFVLTSSPLLKMGEPALKIPPKTPRP